MDKRAHFQMENNLKAKKNIIYEQTERKDFRQNV